MTIPVERTRAVRSTEQLLLDLIDPKRTPRIPKSIRQHAFWCLRHYPSIGELEMTAENYPDLWGKPER